MKLAVIVVLDFDNDDLSDAEREHALEAISEAIGRAKNEGTITPEDSKAYLLGWDVRTMA